MLSMLLSKVNTLVASLGGYRLASSTTQLATFGTMVRPYLYAGNKSGFFQWVSGNQSANVTLDPRQGIWVAPASDPTGTNGAWQRIYIGGAKVEWFRIDSDLDWTNAFVAALNIANVIELEPIEYRVSETAVPSYRTIMGIRGLTRVKARNTSVTTCLFNVTGKTGICLSDLILDGVGKYCAGVSSGADGMRFRNIEFRQLSIAVGTLDANGSPIGYTGTTDILDCSVISCKYGYGNFVDSHFTDGRVTDCTLEGISWSAGSNDNTIIGTKIEFNRGNGVRISSCKNNVLRFGVVDRNSVAGVRLYNCTDHIVSGVFRRNGKDVTTLAADDRCHLYYESCTGLSIDMQTEIGAEDNGTGDITPTYSIRVGGGVNSSSNVTIMGDITGCTGTLVFQEATTGANALDCVFLATGFGEKRIADVKFRYGYAYRWMGTATAAVSSTASFSVTNLGTMTDGDSREQVLTITIKNRTSKDRSVSQIPYVLRRESGVASVILGTPVTRVGSAEAIGGGTLTLQSFTVALANGGTIGTVVVANASSTIAYDVTVKIT